MYQIQIYCPHCSEQNIFILPANDPKFHCRTCGADCGESTPIFGILYVLRNKSIPGLLKIGFTTRTIEERVAELGASTSAPTPFEVLFYFACSDPQGDESLAHKALRKYRVNQQREFFQISETKALEILRATFGRKETFRETESSAFDESDNPLVKEALTLKAEWRTTAGAVKTISLVYRLIHESKYNEAKFVLDFFLKENPDHLVAQKQLKQVKSILKRL